jgi:hypothetical protein
MAVDGQKSETDPLPAAEEPHQPYLLEKCVRELSRRSQGRYGFLPPFYTAIALAEAAMPDNLLPVIAGTSWI